MPNSNEQASLSLHSRSARQKKHAWIPEYMTGEHTEEFLTRYSPDRSRKTVPKNELVDFSILLIISLTLYKSVQSWIFYWSPPFLMSNMETFWAVFLVQFFYFCVDCSESRTLQCVHLSYIQVFKHAFCLALLECRDSDACSLLFGIRWCISRTEERYRKSMLEYLSQGEVSVPI